MDFSVLKISNFLIWEILINHQIDYHSGSIKSRHSKWKISTETITLKCFNFDRFFFKKWAVQFLIGALGL